MKEKRAYEMMYRFLAERYTKLPSDGLGQLLGELQLSTDGRPYDQAIIREWNTAVEEVEAANT